MPTTVNGIGTHYYGKKNVQVRQGVCLSCNRTGPLTSYDTRLWFVFVFIPIIPLGRKRIIDQCAACSRHFAANADQYQMAKQLNVSGALDKYRTAPSPEAAIEAHGQLIAFHQFDEATALRETALATFPHDAELHVTLALQLQYCGHTDDANKLFDAGFRLRPDLPMARVAMARRLMRELKLDDARALLDFLEQPGAGQLHSLEPLDELAGAYQHAGRHEEALSICSRLLEDLPAVAEHHQFRKFVQKSEKALRRTESILPKQDFSLRKFFDPKAASVSPGKRWAAIGGVVAVVATIVLAVNNKYTRHHRRVLVVNAFDVPAQVDFDGKTTVNVQGKQEFVLSEGAHRASITGPVDEQVDFELRSGYFERWFSRPVWFLNVGGKQTFSFTRIHYSVNPAPSAPEFIIGEKFRYLDHVDYAFTSPPDTMQVEGNQEVVKTHLDITPASDPQLMHYLEHNRGADASLAFAEMRLRHKLLDDKLLELYFISAMKLGQRERAKEFLKTGLSARPVSIAWHRAYQNLCQTTADRQQLGKEYDKLLQQDSKNAALLYLRGRVAEEPSEGRDFFQRSLAADPTLPWPWYALAYDAASTGKWQECLTNLKKAQEFKLDIDVYDELLHACRMGLGEQEQLIAEYRQSLTTQSPVDAAQTLIRLSDALCAQNKPDEAWAEFSKWQTSIAAIPDKAAAVESVRLALEYLAGNLDKLCQPLPEPNSVTDYFQLQALLALRKPTEILGNDRLESLLKEPWNALSLALVLEVGGDSQQAKSWREKALASLDEGIPTQTRIASMLRGDQGPTKDELDQIAVSSQQKALLLAVLSARFPLRRSEYLDQANQMNVVRSPPYQLVLAISEMPKPP